MIYALALDGPVDIVIWANHRSIWLEEDDWLFGNLSPHLGSMIGVVFTNADNFAPGYHGSQNTNALEWNSFLS